MNPSEISIQDYSYDLPEEKIAVRPLAQRDASKLLIYKDGAIAEAVFANITNYLPAESLLVFNNTRVINARLRFKKSSGAAIEIFCLEPKGALTEYSSVMSATGISQWKCLVGGAAKWKNETLEKEIIINGMAVVLQANMMAKLSESYLIEFSWAPGSYSFAEILEVAGDTPLPPYIKRSTETEDSERYQTIFAKEEGSVAAPTAGLHFTKEIFTKFVTKNIQTSYVTLHVGAGTFKPVKAASMGEHEMHAEYIDVTLEGIDDLKSKIGCIAAVGTTSLRTIESLYWLGVKALLEPGITNLVLNQWDVYQAPLLDANIKSTDALEALTDWLKRRNLKRIFTQTQLLIAPGYKFRMTDMLVTNFHQPQSTLLLLVAAAIGDDWKKTYAFALQNNFRFLSYGDANLVFVSKNALASMNVVEPGS